MVLLVWNIFPFMDFILSLFLKKAKSKIFLFAFIIFIVTEFFEKFMVQWKYLVIFKLLKLGVSSSK